ncbi:MAG: GNAT family N-acetyltransferase [Clostridia bacterium]|nr:GNAT family N-acetyltransferase [Clostridia bacterium]
MEPELKVIGFFESGQREHWLEEIGRSDWSAGAFLCRLLRDGTFFETVGERSEVLLLTDGDELVSYCTFAEKDDIQPTELTPWIGFVYTFPAHRGRRRAGLLIDEVERRAKRENIPAVYLSTNHVGLYEKYGFRYETMMTDFEGNPSRIYVKQFCNTEQGER